MTQGVLVSISFTLISVLAKFTVYSRPINCGDNILNNGSEPAETGLPLSTKYNQTFLFSPHVIYEMKEQMSLIRMLSSIDGLCVNCEL